MIRRLLGSPARSFFGLSLVVCFSAVGCASKSAREQYDFVVDGRVVNAGEPLALDAALAEVGAASVRVSFVRLVEGGGFGESQTVVAAPDGTFRGSLPGPGRYRVGVEHYNGDPQDLLKGRFGSENSPIELDIEKDPAGGPTNLTIDLEDYAKKKPRKS